MRISVRWVAGAPSSGWLWVKRVIGWAADHADSASLPSMTMSPRRSVAVATTGTLGWTEAVELWPWAAPAGMREERSAIYRRIGNRPIRVMWLRLSADFGFVRDEGSWSGKGGDEGDAWKSRNCSDAWDRNNNRCLGQKQQQMLGTETT